jgi:hypothetical protein
MSLVLRSFQALAMALGVIAASFSAGAVAGADDPAGGLEGTWKLVVLAFGEDEFAVIKVEQLDGKPRAAVLGAQQMIVGNPRELTVNPITIDGNTLTFVLKSPGGDFRFQGKLAEAGAESGKILGSFSFRGEVHPAWLLRTDSNKVAALKPSPLVQEYFAAAQDKDPHSKIQKLKEAIKKHAESPTNHLFYTELLGSAEAGGLTAAEVEELARSWMQEAAPFGEAWIKEVRQKLVKALGNARPYAGLTVELAQQVEKDLENESNLEGKAAVAAVLARAARLTGKVDLAAAAASRAAKLEQQLDEDYHKKVPPFQPDAFSGRKTPGANRVVLMELFTGAQCPPCVAADVAFDALLSAYKPTEVIGLQYHLHIPGPDPLTNKDTVARQEYYGDEIGGTPTALFNGRARAGGGGPMQASQEKFREFQAVVDPSLESNRDAKIDLSATRAGDLIEIKASVTLTGKALSNLTEKEKDQTKDATGGSIEAGSKLRLRLVLVEDSIRYVGKNHLRFHHHVVRAMPGGPEGKILDSGSGKVTVKLNLADLKREIEDYLSDRAKIRPFPGLLPDVALNDLSVVAFVQDDADKRVLDAVTVSLKPLNP